MMLSGQLFGAGDYPHIKDPSGLLKKMDQFMGRPRFEDAYQCGTKIRYEMNYCAQFCEPFLCMEICDPKIKEYLIQIKDCSKNSVTVHTLSSGKDWFKRNPDENSRFNFLREFFSAPWSGELTRKKKVEKNYLELTSIKEEMFQLKNRTLEARRLFFTYYHFDKNLNTYVPSKHSIVMGKQQETQGLHLEHDVVGHSKPIARVVEIIPTAK